MQCQNNFAADGLWSQIVRANLHNAGFFVPGDCQYCSEIQIVGEHNTVMQFCISHDVGIRCM